MQELDQTHNIRSIVDLDDTELTASLEKSGWIPQFPAFSDENGVLIVGHRRIKIAKRLGIAPVIETIHFGNGSEGDAKKFELAIASNIGAVLTKKDRESIAVLAYQRGYTQDQIGKILGVSQQTIMRDLDKSNLSAMDKLKPAKTTTNPKGAGRPRGSRSKQEQAANDTKPKSEVTSEKKEEQPTVNKPESVPKPHYRAAEVMALFDTGSSRPAIATETGLSKRVVDDIVHEERLRRDGVPQISRDDLSLTAQQKFDLAIKQEKHRLAVMAQAVIIRDVNKGIRERLETITPKLIAEQAEAQRIIKGRRGIMTKKAYKKVWSCLHPDRAMQPARDTDEGLQKAYSEAFDIFSKLERLLLDEQNCPTPVDMKSEPVPKTWEEWEERGRKFAQERKAKYAARANKGKDLGKR